MICISFILFLFFNFSSSERVVCPFNPTQCNCTGDDPESLIFSKVECRSETSEIPDFFAPPFTRYTVTDRLIISNSDISNISSHHFVAFRRISTLELNQKQSSEAAYQQWDDNAFANVTIMDLCVIGLDGVLPPQGALRNLGAAGLQKLFVSSGHESIELANDIFKSFISLVELGIEKIQIRKIESETFSGLYNQLISLDLSSTSLNAFPHEAIRNLRKLKQLVLDNNGITGIPHSAFMNFPQLIGLSLSDNSISDAISKGALDELPPTLKSLMLQNVGLTAIPRRVIKNMPLLSALLLSKNSINLVKGNDFDKCSSLKILFLDENPIKVIERGALSPLRNVIVIDLTKTSLPSFDLQELCGLSMRQLQVDLSDTKTLKSLAATSFSKFPDEALISVKATGLERIDARIENLLQKYPKVKIDISYNEQLICENLTWMIDVNCPQQMRIDFAKCADKQSQTLSDYLKSVSPNTKCCDTMSMDFCYRGSTTKRPSGGTIPERISYATAVILAITTVWFSANVCHEFGL